MGRVRTGVDNASAKSVLAQLKREWVHRCRFRTQQEATERINQYFLKIYNPWRRMPIPTPNRTQKKHSMRRQSVQFVDQKGTKSVPDTAVRPYLYGDHIAVQENSRN